jgi:hypothetical protein
VFYYIRDESKYKDDELKDCREMTNSEKENWTGEVKTRLRGRSVKIDFQGCFRYSI